MVGQWKAVSQACNSCGWLTSDRPRFSLPLCLEMAPEKSTGFLSRTHNLQHISSCLLPVKRGIGSLAPF